MGKAWPVLIAGLLAALVLISCQTDVASKYEPAARLMRLDVRFAEPIWGGEKIPFNQQCRRLGGRGASPGLVVFNIPPEANALLLEFSDQDDPKMDNGGHGVIGYMIPPGTRAATIPSISGETKELKEPFFVVTKPRKSGNGRGVYLPPCAEERDHLYYVTVMAVFKAQKSGEKNQLLGQGKLVMGRY
jgi:phosphatidylethanolamine-binding protein (PEBP) family uncharacterized protein